MTSTAIVDTESPKNSGRAPHTGARSGIRGIAAAALLREGTSANETSKITGLSYESVQAIRDRWSAGLEHVDAIRKTLRDVGVLTAAELLFGIDPKDIAKMSVEKRIDAACKLIEKYAAPERIDQPAYVQVLNQYNITPSHSASQRTIEQKTPQDIQLGTSQPKQLNELDGK